MNIITSFQGVTLEVGGDVETYWKSMAMPVASISPSSPPQWPHRSNLIGSAHASPSAHSITNTGGQALTISSLRGTYIHAIVQVTKDLHPVVYSDWLLANSDFDLGVCDVTLAQFEAMAQRLGKDLSNLETTEAIDWPSRLSGSMISLAQLLKVCANSIMWALRLLISIASLVAPTPKYQHQPRTCLSFSGCEKSLAFPISAES